MAIVDSFPLLLALGSLTRGRADPGPVNSDVPLGAARTRGPARVRPSPVRLLLLHPLRTARTDPSGPGSTPHVFNPCLVRSRSAASRNSSLSVSQSPLALYAARAF